MGPALAQTPTPPVSPSPPATAPAAPSTAPPTASTGSAGSSGTAPAPVQRVEIIGTSPLPGQGVERDALPYSTQLIRRGALDAAQADNTTDFMARRMPGVQVNDAQGSPFQGELTFRGYRASGLLGSSQGMSVYLDGVRVNEAFGDLVNWDMVPEFALQSIALVPGANPAFGLNTLGGALSLTTASGTSAPGFRGEFSYGSFQRKRLELSHGGTHDNGWHHFVGTGLFDEKGWRDYSPGRLGTVFAKVGKRDDRSDFALNLLVGRSRLVGNGPVPLVRFDDLAGEVGDIGAGRRAAIYTHPDVTRNRKTQLSAHGRVAWDAATAIEGLAYVRDTQRDTLNGDEAEEAPTPGTPGGDLNAAFNRSATRQRGQGVSVALSRVQGAHRWQLGATLDTSSVSYRQTEQEASFDATRGVVGGSDDEGGELSVSLRGRSAAAGIYATDTWKLSERTHLTATLRLNQARVSNTLTSVDDDTDILTERPREAFTYRSLNPAVGLTHRIDFGGAALSSPTGDAAAASGASGMSVTLFGNVARNNRVPTVIELGCADPAEPCRLPAGLQSDPYLKQVVATGVEAGARWRLGSAWRGSATVFRSDNRDDILFRSVSITGQRGYFQNFAKTRNEGFDLDLEGRWGALNLSAAYGLLNATYQADGVLRVGERNVVIERGTRIAGIPRHTFKLGADWQVTPTLSFGADLQAFSKRGVSGNEDGRLEDGGDADERLELKGYTLLNLRVSWKPAAMKGLEAFVRVNNLLDERYESFGALGETRFSPQGAYTGVEADALFVAPGAPRAFTVGVRWRF
jgi:hypothetical protein